MGRTAWLTPCSPELACRLRPPPGISPEDTWRGPQFLPRSTPHTICLYDHVLAPHGSEAPLMRTAPNIPIYPFGPWLRRSPWHFALTAVITTLVVFHSIPHNLYAMGGDAILPGLNPDIALAHLNSTWDWSAGLGGDGSFARALLFPFVLLDWPLYHAGVPPVVLNNGWVAAIVVAQALSTTWLFRVLFPKTDKIYSVFAGVIAVVNPYMLLTLHTPYPPTALSIAVAPALVAAALVLARRPCLRTLFLFMLISAVMATGDNNYGVTAAEYLFIIPVLALAARGLATNRLRLQFGAVAALTFFATNFLWLLPGLVYSLGAFGTLAAKTAAYSASTLRVTAQYSGLLNSSRLIGDYLFFNSVGGRPYIVGGSQYVENGWLIAASCVLPALALSGALIYRKDRRVVAAAGFTIVALFLAKGTAPPLGSIFGFLVVHLTALNAFRDSFSKFEWVVMYGYAILGSLALAAIGTFRRHSASKVVAAILACGALAGAYPIVEGELFAHQALTPVPARYFAMARWFNAEPSRGAILEMPVSPYAYDVYRWGYVGAGLLPNLIRRPVLSRMDFTSTETQVLDNAFQYAYTRVGSANIANLLGLYGVRYIVNDPSIEPKYFSPTFSSTLLTGAPMGMRLVRKFGSISVYSVPQSRLNGLFYVPRTVYLSAEGFTIRNIVDLCRIRGSCRSTAFAPPPRGPTTIPTGAEVSSLGHRPPRSPGTAVYFRPPLGASTGSPSSTPATAPPLLADPGTPSSGPSLPHKLCSANSATASSVFSFNLPAGGVVTAFSLSYAHAAVNPIVYLTTGDSGSYYSAALPRTGGARTFERLFRFGARARTISVSVDVGQQVPARCVTIMRVVLAAVLPTEAAPTLVGNATDYYATPLYVAFHAHLASDYANEPFSTLPVDERGLEGTSTIVPRAPDTASDWTAYESLGPPGGSRRTVTLSPPDSTTQTFSVRGGSADVHQGIGGLAPGADYHVSFDYTDLSGSGASFAVLSQVGDVLLSGQLPYSRVNRPYAVTVLVPPGSASLMLYVYLHGHAASPSRLALSPVRVTFADPASYVTLTGTPDVAGPRSVRIVRLSAASYQVRVTGAPGRYLLVMNSTYSTEWSLSGVKGMQIEHVRVNQDENGWWITGPAGDETFRVVYGVDRWTNWGLAGSASAGLLALALVALPRKRRPKRRRYAHRRGTLPT